MVARLHGESHSPIDAVGIAVAIGDLEGVRVDAPGGIADVLAVVGCLFHRAIELAAAGEAERGRGLEDDFVKLPVAAGVIGLDQHAAGLHHIFKFRFRGIQLPIACKWIGCPGAIQRDNSSEHSKTHPSPP
jgi:hypothetical protein